jgi:hypothetical protein
MPKENTMTTYIGTAQSVSIESDEDGFVLNIVTADDGEFSVNVHAISRELLDVVQKEIGEYWAEGKRLAAEHQRERVFACNPDDDGYGPDDPKHPNWFSTHVAIWDEREGK